MLYVYKSSQIKGGRLAVDYYMATDWRWCTGVFCNIGRQVKGMKRWQDERQSRPFRCSSTCFVSDLTFASSSKGSHSCNQFWLFHRPYISYLSSISHVGSTIFMTHDTARRSTRYPLFERESRFRFWPVAMTETASWRRRCVDIVSISLCDASL